MRNTFAATITELAAADPRIVLLSGDIGNRLFDKFKERCPARFYNCGVAEANMTGMAAGLAMSGLRPFTYTITPFATIRAMEQIRIDICYHHVPVTIVGTGSGLSYASLGPTHHSCDDVAMLRALPNMTIICPGDPLEVKLALAAVLKHDGPAYIRLGKGEPAVHTAAPQFTIGQAIPIMEGNDVCILGCGHILAIARDAALLLEAQGVSTQLYSMHTVKPLDEEMLERVFARFGVVVSVEEHSRIGGLGGAIAEWLAARAPSPTRGRLLSVAVPDRFLCEAGEEEHARQRIGLTPAAIAERVIDLKAQME